MKIMLENFLSYTLFPPELATKNINSAVRAEELRGKVAGFYIDKQIIASAKLIELPDGSKKAEPDLTESDYESMLLDLTKRHKILPSHSKRKKL